MSAAIAQKAPRRPIDLSKVRIARYRALADEGPDRAFAAWIFTDGLRWSVGPFEGATEEAAHDKAIAFYEAQMAERERLRELSARRVEAMASARRKG